MVDRFQNNHADKIFLLSLKAAGTGLNLTAASHVIHYDLWWNPAVEAQATDRAYRIGQDKNVMVHRFITKNTFEEKINEMIQHKKALAEMTVASGENWIGNMSNRELREIFSL
jgi:SNF2 family DNA or RNA helicase